MYANLLLYTQPQRPLLNPKFDLFAWLNIGTDEQILLPAKLVDKIQLMLPEKCRLVEEFLLPDDTWEFITWQVEEKGYAVIRTIDQNWLYWSILADKWSLFSTVGPEGGSHNKS